MRYTKTTICALLSIALVACGSGKGLDAKLDASKGYDVDYHASLSKAFLDMTKEQQAAYNWVVQPLSQEYFIAYYGKTPTVRAVINGQLDKFKDNNAKEIAAQVVFLAEKASEVAETKALQKKARDLLDSVTATATITPAGKQTDSVCKGIACTSSETNDQLLIVDYVVKNPSNLNLSVLPCSIEITTQEKDTYTSDLSSGCARAGSFRHKVLVPSSVDIKTATYKVLFKDEAAMTASYDPAIPADHPAVKRLKDLEEIREEIAKARQTLG